MGRLEFTEGEKSFINHRPPSEPSPDDIPLCYSDLIIYTIVALPFISKVWEWYSKS